MKAFILMEKGYEYDDNYYNPVDGGSPQKVYFSKQEAEKARNEKNIEMFKIKNIRDYSYDIEDIILDIEKLNNLSKILINKYGIPVFKNKWQTLGEYQLHPQANEDESKEYIDLVDMTFYTIESVDVDVSSFRGNQINSILDNKEL